MKIDRTDGRGFSIRKKKLSWVASRVSAVYYLSSFELHIRKSNATFFCEIENADASTL